ncbi:porin family protein [Sphingomonas sp.]|uniref:outer membrane protein n=1 Tax=Sphingomonas sp. TaxID=28214 RepID=UPI001E0A448F|nr:porin family protein [Sphingomonas sp.]MBX9797159.1 porin family protein [Sphingomonas sp.]
MKIHALIGAGLLVALNGLTASPAAANPHGGFYVGADTGYEGSGRIDQGGVTYGLFAGYNLAVSDKVILGIEARVGDSEIDETLTRTTPTFTTVTRNAIGLHYGAAARMGYALSKRTLVYARGGWENVRLRSVSTRTSVPPTTGPNPVVTDASFNDDTLVVGAGVEHRITDTIGLRLSYDYGENFDRHQVRAGVVFAF